MIILIGLLTVGLVLNCLFLMLLVLIQLPKKEAGAGVAFGGGAADALFGAGSGNALTKLTKYSASIFIGLALILSLLNSKRAEEGNRRLEDLLRQKAAQTPTQALPAAPKNEFALPPKVEDTNLPTVTTNSVTTNAPAANANTAPAISTNRPAPASTNQTSVPAVSPAPATTTTPITPALTNATPARTAVTNPATTNPTDAPKK